MPICELPKGEFEFVDTQYLNGDVREDASPILVTVSAATDP